MDHHVLLIRNCHLGEDRPELAKPFLLEVAGETWTAATDGYQLFAAVGALGEAVALDGKRQQTMGDHLVEAIALAVASTTPLDLVGLLQAAGLPERRTVQTCASCDGTGAACTCGECECGECDEGKIYNSPKVRKGFVCGRLVDLNRLACLLTGVDGPLRTEARELWSAKPARPLYFAGDGWCAVLVPLNVDYESEADVAAFPRWETRAAQ